MKYTVTITPEGYTETLEYEGEVYSVTHLPCDGGVEADRPGDWHKWLPDYLDEIAEALEKRGFDDFNTFGAIQAFGY